MRVSQPNSAQKPLSQVLGAVLKRAHPASGLRIQRLDPVLAACLLVLVLPLG